MIKANKFYTEDFLLGKSQIITIYGEKFNEENIQRLKIKRISIFKFMRPQRMQQGLLMLIKGATSRQVFSSMKNYIVAEL